MEVSFLEEALGLLGKCYGGVVVCLRAASMERILQENEALDSIIQRYLDSQNEVTQRTRDLYAIHFIF